MVVLQDGSQDWKSFLPDPGILSESGKSEPQLVSPEEMAKGPVPTASPGLKPLASATPSVLTELATDDDGAAQEDEDEEGDQGEILAQTREEFRDFLEETFDVLPRLSDLRKLSAEETHATPAVIREGAAQMAEVAEKLDRNPEFKPEALEFYQKCSLETEIATSIRALCLNHALRLYAELHGKLWEFDREKIPDSLIELSKRL